MYSLLIVDDERMARESVHSLLATQEDLELELMMVDSAIKAVSVLETERIDITIMDINMPQMTGLELYSVVRQKWPQCKVIFLTGYSEFDYVYQVHKHARYVLKGDREEVLLEAVRESIREIERDMLLQRTVDIDPEFKKRAGHERASVFLTELIDGYVPMQEVNNELLRDMSILLDYRKPVFPLLIRCGAILERSYQRSLTLCVQIYRLLERYFGKNATISINFYKKVNLFLMVQPDEPLAEAAEVRRLASMCSLFQNALQLNADTDARILIADRSYAFTQAIGLFFRMLDRIGSVQPGDTQIQSLEETTESLQREDVLRSLLQLERTVEDVGFENIKDAFTGIHGPVEFRNWQEAIEQLNDLSRQATDRSEQARGQQEERLVTRIKRYIDSHLKDGPSLTDIADHYHFSREYLLRVFKKEEGVTILSYINDLKLDKAKARLTGTSMQVREIAEDLGFSSTAYFIRFFRTKTGMSPQAWRDQHSKI